MLVCACRFTCVSFDSCRPVLNSSTLNILNVFFSAFYCTCVLSYRVWQAENLNINLLMYSMNLSHRFKSEVCSVLVVCNKVLQKSFLCKAKVSTTLVQSTKIIIGFYHLLVDSSKDKIHKIV